MNKPLPLTERLKLFAEEIDKVIRERVADVKELPMNKRLTERLKRLEQIEKREMEAKERWDNTSITCMLCKADVTTDFKLGRPCPNCGSTDFESWTPQ